MKRPILIAVIGYIIGILWGLYLQKSIVPTYITIIAIYLIYKISIRKTKKKLKLFSFKRYFRYIKIYINKKTVIFIIIISIISNTIILEKTKEYNNICNMLSDKEIETTGIVVSDKIENKYYNKYKIKTKINNKNIKLYITTTKKIELKYGDKISISGKYTKAEGQRNYKGFDYYKYLRQVQIYGTIKTEKINIIESSQYSKIMQISNKIRNELMKKAKEIFSQEVSSIFLGITIGYKEDISEEVQENFRNSSLSHILSISGMHVAYIVLGINIILKKIIGKRKTYMCSIIIIILYIIITNFSVSVIRAGIMGIMVLCSKIFYKKNDIYTSFSISLLLSLIYNPYIIEDLGLQLSYGGLLGIVFFNKRIIEILNNIKIKNKDYQYKIKPAIEKRLNNIKQIISTPISVQLIILPIIINRLNTFNPYFLISNLLISVLIGPIIIISFIFMFLILINFKIANITHKIVEIGIQILILISDLGKLKWSKIYIPTPSLFSIIIYYIFIIALFSIYKIYHAKKPNITQMRFRNLIALVKIKLRKKENKFKKIIIFMCSIVIIFRFIPQKLKIYFIDIGQGDSCLIITPHNKTVLIDGGGSTNSDTNIGKNTLLPYILDRGFNKIDFIIISHFDSDHVRTDYLQ